MYTLHTGDCLEALQTLPDNSVDSVVCDPPYGLEFMGKEWDKLEPNRNQQRWKGMDRKLIGDGSGKGGDFGERMGEMPQYRPNRNAKCLTCGHYRFSGTPCKCESPEWDRRTNEHSRAMQEWHEQWAIEVLRVLKPGGHLLAFGGTRTYHRMTCAIEDAGFEIRDCIQWLYGQGFPKSHDVSKSLDKRAGAERTVIGTKRGVGGDNLNDIVRGSEVRSTDDEGGKGLGAYGTGAKQTAVDVPITMPATDAARQWQGWGTALKPANEPIVLARKPLIGTVAANTLTWGVGGINIDACRIATPDALGGGNEHRVSPYKPEGWDRPWMHDPDAVAAQAARVHTNVGHAEALGRWPANVILSHHPDCQQIGTRRVKAPILNRFTDGAKPFGDGAGHPYASVQTGDTEGMEEQPVWDCHDDCPVALLDAQSGERPPLGRSPSPDRVTTGVYHGDRTHGITEHAADTGGASRYFKTFYGDEEWECHPDCAVRLLDAQTGTLTSGYMAGEYKAASEQAVNYGSQEPAYRETYGDSGGASRFFYCAKASTKERNEGLDDLTPRASAQHYGSIQDARPQTREGYEYPRPPQKNTHPTVKPVALMDYLIRLVTPPGGTVLDPFTGSGTTGVAAVRGGWDFIGIEKDPEYAEIARARLDHAAMLRETPAPRAIDRRNAPNKQQLPLEPEIRAILTGVQAEFGGILVEMGQK